ncbi:bifunctional riboflavin kinase/FAD synthetase [Aquibaculum sediminis]|uniref:bifunctional riboflavin kinase/FAD synthetase n=1 Tax=Aquibaculum sediminis TaxID=3231907 RepID=UPI003455AF9C
MRLIRHPRATPPECRNAVAVIGNFDGIHRGHMHLLEHARALATARNAPWGMVTFEPHPRRLFAPDLAPFRLTPLRVKARLLQSLGVEVLWVLRFNRALAGLTPEAFAREVLHEGLALKHVVVGANFRFGNRRAGDVDALQQYGQSFGFGVSGLGMASAPGQAQEVYSSSLVRDYLQAGNPTRAALLLGRYWEIEGRVHHGAKRGRELGFPTANILLGRDTLRPAFGIYAVRVAVEGASSEGRSTTRWLPGVANLGISPMFNYAEPLLEVHLIDYQGDLYGRHLRVAFIDYLRPEARFDSLDALKNQMTEDLRRARATLAWEDWQGNWPASSFLPIRPGES